MQQQPPQQSRPLSSQPAMVRQNTISSLNAPSEAPTMPIGASAQQHHYPVGTPLNKPTFSYTSQSAPRLAGHPPMIDRGSTRLTSSAPRPLVSTAAAHLPQSSTVRQASSHLTNVIHRPPEIAATPSYQRPPQFTTSSALRQSSVSPLVPNPPLVQSNAALGQQQNHMTASTSYTVYEPHKSERKQPGLRTIQLGGHPANSAAAMSRNQQATGLETPEGFGFRSPVTDGTLMSQQANAPATAPTTTSLGHPRYGNVPLIAPDSFNEVKAVVANYENLLAAERQEYELVLRARDEEARTLMAHLNELQMAIKGKSDEVDIQALLRTKEDELRMLFKSRDKQIVALERKLEAEEELRRNLKNVMTEAQPACESASQQEVYRMKRILEHREAQLKQAEVVANTRQEQYQSLLKDLAVKEAIIQSYKPYHPEDSRLQASANKTAHQLDYLESEVTAMRQIIDELSFEKQELQQILIQKDKQIACMGALDPSMTEASAVQLSVQAISMVQSAVELKEQIRSLEGELMSLQERCNDFKDKFEETHKKLTEKRQEAAGLVETLATRDMRIARLDTLLQHRDKEFNQLKEELRISLSKEREKCARLEMEIRIAIDQQLRLREELSNRDDRILDLKNEVVRQSKFNQESENRIQLLSNELKEAQKHLQKLIKQNVAKDRYMLELERRMKDNDVKRQATYLSEVAKNRKLQLDLRLREDDARHVIYDKEEQIANLRTELFTSSKQVDAVKNLLMAATSIPQTATITADELAAAERVNDGTTTAMAARSTRRRRSAEDDNSPNHNVDHVSADEHHRQLFHSVEPRSRRRVNSPEGKSTARLQKTSSLLMSDMLNEDASPDYSDADVVELLLHETLRKKQHRPIRSLFCRVGRGSYLFGTHKVAFRVSSKGHLEAQTDPNVDVWIPFDSFVTAMETRLAADSTVAATKYNSIMLTGMSRPMTADLRDFMTRPARKPRTAESEYNHHHGWPKFDISTSRRGMNDTNFLVDSTSQRELLVGASDSFEV